MATVIQLSKIAFKRFEIFRPNIRNRIFLYLAELLKVGKPEDSSNSRKGSAARCESEFRLVGQLGPRLA